MVLSASAPPPSPAQGVDGWIEEIRQGLRLSPAGVLLLADSAVPEKLGPLVRALLAENPGLEVLTKVAELEQAEDGAVIVFLPEASDAEWLNFNRPLFARKALKVVLFSSRDVSTALAQRAPDFFDWISHRQECMPGVAEHAVQGIRKAVCARAPGVVFVGRRSDRDRVERAERVFHEALPGRPLRWLTPGQTRYEDLVAQVRGAGRAWVACDALGYAEAERFRWALAEVRRRTRALLVLPEVFEDRFWFVSDALWDTLGGASALLRSAGAKHPGRLAAVAGGEFPVVASLIELLARGYREDALLAAMLASPDPGAGLAERILSAGVESFPLQGWLMSSPVQRSLGGRIGLRRKFPGRAPRKVDRWLYRAGGGVPPLLRGRADRIEFLLYQGIRTPERWIELARLALDHGDHDVAVTWAGRSLALRESSEAHRLHGMAGAELGRRSLAMGVIPEAGLSVDAPRALRSQGHPERAEVILKSALAQTRDPAEQARIRLELGLCAFAQQRFEEAETMAAALSKDLDARGMAERSDLQLAADTLRIRAWLSLDEPQKALEVADAALAAAAPRRAALDDEVLLRMPMLAVTLNRGGRAPDAEAVLRKLLGLPIEADTGVVAMGLSSQNEVRALLDASLGLLRMSPSTRRDLWNELVQALRAQGRHVEAAEMERRRDKESGPAQP